MSAVLDEVVGTGQVKNRKIFINHRRAFDQAIARLDERWTLEITVKRLAATRSPQANKYYWGVVIEAISRHTGYSPEEVHDLMKMLHLPKALAICNGNGEIVGEYVMGGTTRKLTVAEFYTYVEKVRQWAIETLDLIIPEPMWRAA